MFKTDKKVDIKETIKLPIDYDSLSSSKKKIIKEQYIVLQNGLCWYCKKPLSDIPADHIRKKPIDKTLFPPTFFDYPLHLHHNHETGLTIGVVHNYCNAVLWEYHGE